MNSVSKNVCVDKIGNIVYKHNNTYHSTIKMQHFDIKSSTHVDNLIKNNKGDPKLTIGDHERISKYQNIFVKRHTPNWFEEDSVIKKLKKSCVVDMCY